MQFRLSSSSLAPGRGEGQAMGLAVLVRPTAIRAPGAERMPNRNSQPHLLDTVLARMPRPCAGKEQQGEADSVILTASPTLRLNEALTTTPRTCPRRVRI